MKAFKQRLGGLFFLIFLMVTGWNHIVTEVSFNLKIIWIYIIIRKQAT